MNFVGKESLGEITESFRLLQSPEFSAGELEGCILRAVFALVWFLENVSRNVEHMGTLKRELDGMNQNNRSRLMDSVYQEIAEKTEDAALLSPFPSVQYRLLRTAKDIDPAGFA